MQNVQSDFCGLLVTRLTEFSHIVGVIMQFTVSNRQHFDGEVPCIHVTIDYFEILSLLCHQGNYNILIPAPAEGGEGELSSMCYI